jgi:Xaa-Pro aminopeptidase
MRSAVQFVPNVQQLKALPATLGASAVVAMSPENFAYVSGVFILTVTLVRPRQGYVIVPAKGDPVMVICSIEKTLAEADGWIKDIRTYTEFADNPIDALTAALKSLGLTTGKLGIDLDFLPASSQQRLLANLPGVALVNSTEDIARIRAIKTPNEVAFMEATTKQTHKAVLDAMAASKLGDTELAMANRIATGIINNGADGTLFIVFASGERTSQAHAHATERVPKPSEIIRFDVGGTYGAWASDFARTYSTGSPTNLQSETYANLAEIEKATIEMVKPGVIAEDVFFFCRDQFAKRGMPFHMPHIGHSFGVELHESPMLRPGDKTVIKAGMVLNVEPMATDGEGSYYHLEDLFVVTDSGPRILTHGLPPKEIPVIGQKITY